VVRINHCRCSSSTAKHKEAVIPTATHNGKRKNKGTWLDIFHQICIHNWNILGSNFELTISVVVLSHFNESSNCIRWNRLSQRDSNYIFWSRLVLRYRRFGTACLSVPLANCPETTATNYHSMPSKIPEERTSTTQVHSNFSLKSRVVLVALVVLVVLVLFVVLVIFVVLVLFAVLVVLVVE